MAKMVSETKTTLPHSRQETRPSLVMATGSRTAWHTLWPVSPLPPSSSCR
jgi:hypothetical protein